MTDGTSTSRPARSTSSRRPAPSPSEVAPGVYVGGWNDALRFDGARYCVMDTVPDEEVPADVRLPVYDPTKDRPHRENLDQLAELVSAARAQGRPVLLFCGYGIRRAPLAAAWYLHRAEGLSLDAAYDRIRRVRPKVEHVRQWVGDRSTLGTAGGASG